MLRVLLIEPYYTGSHRAWADGLQQHSAHDVRLLTLPGQFWKWRMQGGAVTLARLYDELVADSWRPQVILASDMFDLSTFRALTRQQTAHIPVALYFHENQLSYPQNSRQRHGWRYGFINYISALAADALWFNSHYHLSDFFAMLPRMLKHFADYNELQTVDALRARASVLPLGMGLARFDAYQPDSALDADDSTPLLLWNHRWEEEKNPRAFFDALYGLQAAGYDFRVALAGENVRQEPQEFLSARERLGAKVVHYGYAESFAAYARLLWSADYVVSTSYQDFFGIAITEAMYCGCVPLLPRRLNYPYLVPQAQHASCLYGRGKLLALLRHHLDGRLQADPVASRAAVEPFDWSQMAARYDAALAALA